MSKIIGIGNDIIKISRIKSSFEKGGDRFLKRAFHDEEINNFKELFLINNEKGIEYLAGRWAAKESIYKAFGGQERSKLGFPNIKILNEQITGKPIVNLQPPTFEYAKELGVKNIHIAISHDSDFAIANVILES
ncbi:hypothetical protein DLAC_01061 [Tieghemostelium lacteum]|uniref:4'-phosphopantetheinyl transferase domain-containing protein n=1 Tax=Tieghemostelium lacteum TaxID=361077 RepID=A0A152A864_TIELA|nr:hypothetical protein DLAC_01061 [Tieghemostelium lacteum]|eukprot:KYR02237.1 hypothetical protein DLAC_01061 [Tieghemostelium lacteum]